MIQASTIPTIPPALRLVGATPGAETKQIKLDLKLQPHSLVYEYALFFWPIMLAQGSLQNTNYTHKVTKPSLPS